MPTPLTDADKVLRNDTGKDIVEKLDDIAQALGVGVNADQINYNNTTSGLESENVQDAVDEVKEITDNLDNKLDGLTDIISTASGTIATFNDGGDNIPLKSCEVAIVAQQASGTPSPSNPLSISGFSAIDCTDCGINLWDEQWEHGGYHNATGEKTDANRVRNKYKIMVKPNTSIYIKLWSGATNDISLFLYDANGTYLRTTLWKNEGVYTIPSDCYFICFHTAMSYQTYNYDISFNYPSTDTSYHAYTGTTHTIALPETIYGGNASLTDGTGAKDFGYIEFDGSSDENWSASSGANGTFIIAVSDAKIVDQNVVGDIISNRMQAISYSTGYYSSNIFGIAFGSSSNQLRVNVDTSVVTKDLTTFKTWLSNNPLQVRYELSTPTSFSFTPESIPTLSGENNIFSNTGDVSVKYFNSKADWLADLIKAMSAT